jgi:hypothetical protein
LQTKNLYGCVIKGLDDYLPFQRVSIVFKRFIPNGISLTNQHLFFLDGHGSHVTFEVIEQVEEFELDMITLTLHTFHALSTFGCGLLQAFQDCF